MVSVKQRAMVVRRTSIKVEIVALWRGSPPARIVVPRKGLQFRRWSVQIRKRSPIFHKLRRKKIISRLLLQRLTTIGQIGNLPPLRELHLDGAIAPHFRPMMLADQDNLGEKVSICIKHFCKIYLHALSNPINESKHSGTAKMSPLKDDESSWPALNNLTPINLKRTASAFIKEFEKSLTPPPESPRDPGDSTLASAFSKSKSVADHEARLLLNNLP
jgi:hypothetical protein